MGGDRIKRKVSDTNAGKLVLQRCDYLRSMRPGRDVTLQGITSKVYFSLFQTENRYFFERREVLYSYFKTL